MTIINSSNLHHNFKENILLKKICFGIGSNLGDREKYITQAIDKLKLELDLQEIISSQFYVNQAMLPILAPKEWNLEFLNIVMIGKININEFSPLKILEIIKKIEQEIGRINRAKWAYREIDIDILAIEDQEYHDDNLHVPHQGLFIRDFFYQPFNEIDRQWFFNLKNQYKID